MLRRSPLRLPYLLSGYSYGKSANSPFPATYLGHCGSTKLRTVLTPVSTMSPFQSTVSQFLRQYCSKPKKVYKEVNLACPEDIERLKQYLVEAQQERAERRKAKGLDPDGSDGDSEDEPELRYEDYEPELKIFEDPFLDRKPPPEPDEQTKKDVAEMVETLKLLVEKMPMQKPSKKRKGRGNNENDENKDREVMTEKEREAVARVAKILEEGFKRDGHLKAVVDGSQKEEEGDLQAEDGSQKEEEEEDLQVVEDGSQKEEEEDDDLKKSNQISVS